jgi:predicted transcriptional regulator
MESTSFAITAEDLVVFINCLSSKICLRIFRTMRKNERLNVSAIARKARCSNKICVEHLRQLARLGIVEEEFHAGLHRFILKRTPHTELMEQAIELLEEGKE